LVTTGLHDCGVACTYQHASCIFSIVYFSHITADKARKNRDNIRTAILLVLA
jgi:hypothetical protein